MTSWTVSKNFADLEEFLFTVHFTSFALNNYNFDFRFLYSSKYIYLR